MSSFDPFIDALTSDDISYLDDIAYVVADYPKSMIDYASTYSDICYNTRPSI